MDKETRFVKILELLRLENGLPVHVLAQQLGVSHMTIRRDLEIMAAEGSVRRIYGGVILNESPPGEGGESAYSLHSAGTRHVSEKHGIGERAASLIRDEDTLIIDSGSTTEFLARHIPDNLRLTILCYALNIISEVARMGNVRSLFAGGRLHSNLLMFESPEGLSLIRRYRAKRAFISAAGVSADMGVTCRNGYERETKRAVLESSAQRILLADSSKFGAISSEYFADLNDFDIIISDGGVTEEQRATIVDAGIELILV
jgi:DeoR family deoxyribose operon repressor